MLPPWSLRRLGDPFQPHFHPAIRCQTGDQFLFGTAGTAVASDRVGFATTLDPHLVGKQPLGDQVVGQLVVVADLQLRPLGAEVGLIAGLCAFGVVSGLGGLSGTVRTSKTANGSAFPGGLNTVQLRFKQYGFNTFSY